MRGCGFMKHNLHNCNDFVSLRTWLLDPFKLIIKLLRGKGIVDQRDRFSRIGLGIRITNKNDVGIIRIDITNLGDSL